MFVSSTYSVKVISSANALLIQFQIIQRNKNSDKSTCSRRDVVVLLALIAVAVVRVFCPPRLVFAVVFLSSSSESLPRALEDVLVDKEAHKEDDDDACRPLFALVFTVAFE